MTKRGKLLHLLPETEFLSVIQMLQMPRGKNLKSVGRICRLQYKFAVFCQYHMFPPIVGAPAPFLVIVRKTMHDAVLFVGDNRAQIDILHAVENIAFHERIVLL